LQPLSSPGVVRIEIEGSRHRIRMTMRNMLRYPWLQADDVGKSWWGCEPVNSAV
jgi:hypothetical protein